MYRVRIITFFFLFFFSKSVRVISMFLCKTFCIFFCVFQNWVYNIFWELSIDSAIVNRKRFPLFLFRSIRFFSLLKCFVVFKCFRSFPRSYFETVSFIRFKKKIVVKIKPETIEFIHLYIVCAKKKDVWLDAEIRNYCLFCINFYSY